MEKFCYKIEYISYSLEEPAEIKDYTEITSLVVLSKLSQSSMILGVEKRSIDH